MSNDVCAAVKKFLARNNLSPDAIRHRGSGHLAIMMQGKTLIVPSTSSDHRAALNAISTGRRLWGIVETKVKSSRPRRAIKPAMAKAMTPRVANAPREHLTVPAMSLADQLEALNLRFVSVSPTC